MKHSKEEIQAFNKWCAEKVYPDRTIDDRHGDYSVYVESHPPIEQLGETRSDWMSFNPYHDGSDRNLVLDMFRPRVDLTESGEILYSGNPNIQNGGYVAIYGLGPTTDEAQIAYLFEEMNHDSHK